jgi:hypothetical protein
MTAIGQLVNKAIKSIELVVSLQQTPWPRPCVKVRRRRIERKSANIGRINAELPSL